ncbi:hypothetical protein ABZP36_010394 [Zizania latifolia]
MVVIARLVVITPAVLVGRAAAAARVSPSVSRLPLVAGCRAVLGDGTNGGIRGGGEAEGAAEDAAARRVARKRSERRTYLAAAVMSSLGFTSMAAAAVYYRFAWQMDGGEVPAREMLGTFALSVGAAVGMEFWARWVYRALWHMHESHHRPRDGPFELNDVFAIANAVPAISLLAYGLLNRGLLPGLCFGAGLGITLFGMAYMFVHDGLVHRRFNVGPIEDVPYFRRVAVSATSTCFRC